MNMGSYDSFHSDEWGERYGKLSFVGTWKNSKQKTLKFHLEFNLKKFQGKMEKF